MTNREEYRHICEECGCSIPIYSQHWWMEAVCQGKEWDVAIARDQSGQVRATLPYLLGRKWGTRYIIMPPLTQTNGIHYHYPKPLDTRERLSFEKKWATAIISRLGRLGLGFYLQNQAPAVTNWLPFRWAGFRQTTRYTYTIACISDPAAVLASFSSAKQRQVRKAQRNGLQVEENALSPEAFYRYHSRLMAEKGEKDEVSEATFLALAHAALGRGQGCILSIRSGTETQAALFMVWDGNCAYYLVPANSRAHSSTGASTLLVWEAIKRASRTSRAFDFEGSMQESIENSYNQFGTTQTPYSQLSKAYNLAGKLWCWSHL